MLVMTYETTIAALAAPTRRTILEALRTQPLSVQDLADLVPVTQAAVSQHLKRLREAGLVEMEARGTRHVCRLRPEGLASLRAWVESFWDNVLGAYADPGTATETKERDHE